MTPYEMMLSESQERMLIILNDKKEEQAKKIFDAKIFYANLFTRRHEFGHRPHSFWDHDGHQPVRGALYTTRWLGIVYWCGRCKNICTKGFKTAHSAICGHGAGIDHRYGNPGNQHVVARSI